jgi:hypothetical protein
MLFVDGYSANPAPDVAMSCGVTNNNNDWLNSLKVNP